MEKTMNLQDLPDFSDSNNYSYKPIMVIVYLILSLFVQCIHYTIGAAPFKFLNIQIESLNLLVSIAYHILASVLAICGLISFYWTWKERKNKRPI